MSLAQIETEIAQLTREELEHLQAAINAVLKPRKTTVTPEMLARRREIADKFMSGEYATDLPPWQETRAHDKRKDAWNT
jgi:hypothetical protein